MFKKIISKIPYSADLYDAIRPVRPKTRYNLSLKANLPRYPIPSRLDGGRPPQ
jgi:hypothetical protein